MTRSIAVLLIVAIFLPPQAPAKNLGACPVDVVPATENALPACESPAATAGIEFCAHSPGHLFGLIVLGFSQYLLSLLLHLSGYHGTSLICLRETARNSSL